MKAMVRRFLSWFGPAPVSPVPRSGTRVRLPRSVMHALHRATKPDARCREPLAFLLVRYASEDARDVIVAIGVMRFADRAYVEGDAGANFDTRWCVDVANEHVRSNVGLMLAHCHGGSGRPHFSKTDRETNVHVMAALSIGVDVVPYGSLVLSADNATAVVAAHGRIHEANVVVVPDKIGGLDLSA